MLNLHLLCSRAKHINQLCDCAGNIYDNTSRYHILRTYKCTENIENCTKTVNVSSADMCQKACIVSCYDSHKLKIKLILSFQGVFQTAYTGISPVNI